MKDRGLGRGQSRQLRRNGLKLGKWYGFRTGQQSKNRKKEAEEEKMQTMNRKMEKGSDEVNR
jgi:hypothetical protein